MQALQTQPAIHGGNFYSTGVTRVVAKLKEMGIPVPSSAFDVPDPDVEFNRLEHAVLDWFTGRDYDQAQALIYNQQPATDYHVVRLLNYEVSPHQLSDDTLCPTRADAVAAVIYACDRDAIGIDAFRLEGNAIIVVINGVDALKIDAIKYEPFDLSIRDRVRTALKGVREFDLDELRGRAARLPGFAGLEIADKYPRSPRDDACLLLGFPGNWALAMRSALKEVDVQVKQSQAQELAAVFLGASNWHQLIKRQDEWIGAMPVAVTVSTATTSEHRYFRTTEEALFAVGTSLRSYPDPVVAENFGLALGQARLYFAASLRRTDDGRDDAEYIPPCIVCGGNDYWSVETDGYPTLMPAALHVLETLGDSDGSWAGKEVVYPRDGALGILEGMLLREGQSTDNVVQIGDHAIAISVDWQNTYGQLAPHTRARIYKVANDSLNEIADVAMYKADVRIFEAKADSRIIIVPEYGKGEPIEILFTEKTQLKKFLELTDANGIRTHRHSRTPKLTVVPKD